MSQFARTRPTHTVPMPKREVRTLSLTPEHSAFIAGCVDSGRYQSASEVVRDALRLLQDREQKRAAEFERARAMLEVGLDQLDRGEILDGEAVVAAWSELIRKRAKRRRGGGVGG